MLRFISEGIKTAIPHLQKLFSLIYIQLYSEELFISLDFNYKIITPLRIYLRVHLIKIVFWIKIFKERATLFIHGVFSTSIFRQFPWLKKNG